MMTAEFSTQLRVYIEDTDAGGIVYYVNYLKYFERARTEFMRAQGYDKAAFLGADTMFVVTSANVNYRRPALLDDVLTARALLTEVGASRLVFEQSVCREDHVLVDGRVTIALVTRETQRPVRLPTDLRRLLTEVAASRGTVT